MPFSKEGLKKSPYNKCIICDKLGEECDGPNFLCMDIHSLCVWCRLRRDYIGVTNEWIEEHAEVSKNTVVRIMTGKSQDGKPLDFMFTSIQRVAKVLAGGSFGQHPCPSSDRNEDALEWKAECKRLNSVIERKEKEHAETVERLQKESERKMVLLVRALKVVSIVATVIILLMATALVMDLMNHDLGFFWRR